MVKMKYTERGLYFKSKKIRMCHHEKSFKYDSIYRKCPVCKQMWVDFK